MELRPPNGSDSSGAAISLSPECGPKAWRALKLVEKLAIIEPLVVGLYLLVCQLTHTHRQGVFERA